MQRKLKPVRNLYAVEAHFKKGAGPMGKIKKNKNKAERKKIKQDLKKYNIED